MMRDHWNRAALQWRHVGQPLRPAPADIQALKQLLTPHQSARALLLGVTPEIARAVEGAGIRLIAIDRNIEMIQLVWPWAETRDAVAMCGDWKSLPLADASVQWVVGDGCFTLLDYPNGYQGVLREIHRVLSPGGSLVMRYFCRPGQRETFAHIAEDLRSRRIGNIHVLKWRVAMALQGTIQEGVPVDKIWHAINEIVPCREELERHTGWSRVEIDTFDVFRGSSAKFTFPSLDEVREISTPLFQEMSVQIPDYELGSCCPTLVYRSKL